MPNPPNHGQHGGTSPCPPQRSIGLSANSTRAVAGSPAPRSPKSQMWRSASESLIPSNTMPHVWRFDAESGKKHPAPAAVDEEVVCSTAPTVLKPAEGVHEEASPELAGPAADGPSGTSPRGQNVRAMWEGRRGLLERARFDMKMGQRADLSAHLGVSDSGTSLGTPSTLQQRVELEGMVVGSESDAHTPRAVGLLRASLKTDSPRSRAEVTLSLASDWLTRSQPRLAPSKDASLETPGPTECSSPSSRQYSVGSDVSTGRRGRSTDVRHSDAWTARCQELADGIQKLHRSRPGLAREDPAPRAPDRSPPARSTTAEGLRGRGFSVGRIGRGHTPVRRTPRGPSPQSILAPPAPKHDDGPVRSPSLINTPSVGSCGSCGGMCGRVTLPEMPPPVVALQQGVVKGVPDRNSTLVGAMPVLPAPTPLGALSTSLLVPHMVPRIDMRKASQRP